MGVLASSGKATLFATAISVITGGVTLIKDNFHAGLACLIVGIALIVIWAYLIDWQARREARKTALQLFEKFKAEMEEKKRGRP